MGRERLDAVTTIRAGALTIAELAAAGVASILIPFPFAVDDHQTTNARFLVESGGGWLVSQGDLTARWLADMLQKTERSTLVQVGSARG